MNPPAPVATMDVLRDFGFKPNDGLDYGFDESLVFDFATFRLAANLGLTRSYQHMVMLSGNLCTPRTIAMIEFEMPPQVESPEQCGALLAYYLRDYGIRFDREAWWLDEGKQRQDLLPWRRQWAEDEARNAAREVRFAARRKRITGRDWLRLALKTLADRLASINDNASIFIGFRDSLLWIQVEQKPIVLPAEGVPWPTYVRIPAGNIRALPKRLMSDPVCISIWESCLIIDRSHYPGAEDIPGNSIDQETNP